ncbi:MAG TPA: glycosyltransferase family 4 protein [Edaphocola sp.]|nr:glycosyltransferase family 4 protein [Edaphocola sp.]
MNIGIVTTWFERGASYVSKQYMEVLQQRYNVFIYARAGESYAKNNPKWDFDNVYWSKRIDSPFTVTVIDKKEFISWIKKNKIETIIFNEQHWWPPLIWCKELGIKTIAYIDYYTEETVSLFEIYDFLICNTKKHLSAFKWHKGAIYIPWGTEIELFKPLTRNRSQNEKLVFFHSCGMNPLRKGTDLLLKALANIKSNKFKLIIHTQTDLINFFPELEKQISKFEKEGILEVINKTVNAPGLYYLGDVYVYPTRLEGIGLTMVEAIASGLPIIVPDCGPMNEFVQEGVSQTVSVEKLFSRYDGYYWPQNEVDIMNLAKVMNTFINRIDDIDDLKNISRLYAVENFDWSKNSIKIFEIIESKVVSDIISKNQIISKIYTFERKGLRKYNNSFLKFKGIIKLFYKK